MKKFSNTLKTINKINESETVNSQEDFLAFGKKVLSQLQGSGYNEQAAQQQLMAIHDNLYPDYTAMIKVIRDSLRTEDAAINEVEQKIVKILNHIVENPLDRRFYHQLHECMMDSIEGTVSMLIHHSRPILKMLLVENDQLETYRSSKSKQKSKILTENVIHPEHTLQIAEAIGHALLHSNSAINYGPTKAKANKYIHLLQEAYTEYKDDLANTNLANSRAREYFNVIFTSRDFGYYFTANKLEQNLTYDARDKFAWFFLDFFNNWIQLNYEQIYRRSNTNDLNDLTSFYNAYSTECSIVEENPYPLVNTQKLFEIYQVGLASNTIITNPRLRSFYRGYFIKLKPVLDKMTEYFAITANYIKR